MADTLQMSFDVGFSYEVVFTRNLLAPSNPLLVEFCRRHAQHRPARCLVVIDQGVLDTNPELPAQLASYARQHADCLELVREPMAVPGGEAGKNSFEIPLKIIRAARQAHLCRQSYILVIGGGAVLDAAGFAASLIHRGMPLIRIPTTVLSQNDSGIGVKNSVNLGGVKNFLGTFAPPAAVFNDCLFLRTLSDRDWIAGIAEAFKVAIIKDSDFLAWLLHQATHLAQRTNLELMTTLIQRCAKLHMDHIATAGDPFEFGSARPLDFGHWAAHKLESLTNYELRHGEAVGIGMALDLLYAAALGLIELSHAKAVIAAMAQTGLPLWHDVLAYRAPAGRPLLFAGIEEFREHLGGELHVTMPHPLGNKIEVGSIDETILTNALEQLAQLARPVTSDQ